MILFKNKLVFLHQFLRRIENDCLLQTYNNYWLNFNVAVVWFIFALQLWIINKTNKFNTLYLTIKFILK